MKSVIDRMHHNALMHSKRAERLMKQSVELFRERGHGTSGSDTMAKVVELNRKAIDESKRSLRTMDFLLKYKASSQAQEEHI